MVRIINDGDIFGTGHFVATRPPDPTQQTSKVAKKKKGFWADQVSTGGGIGGALAGGAAGAALGSAVPGIGTAIGGLLGAILGGGAGSAGGELAENAIAGEKDLGKNVLQEGLIGGVTSLPIGAGFKLARAGTKALTGVGKQAAGDLVQEAGIQTIGRGAVGRGIASGTFDQAAQDAAGRVATAPSLLNRAGQKLSGTADDMAIKQFRFNNSQVNGLKSALGEDPGSFIRKHGISSVEDITSRGIDPLQNEFDNIVTGLKSVPSQAVSKGFDKYIKPLRESVSLDDNALAKSLQSQADAITRTLGDTISGKELVTLRRKFDDVVKRSAFGSAEMNVNKGTADALRKIVQDSADGLGVKASDGRSIKEIGRDLSRFITLNDVASKQEGLGRGSLPFGLGSAPGAIMGASGGPLGAAAGMAGQAVANSPAGRRVAMTAVDKIAGKLSTPSVKPVGQSLLGATGRFGAVGALESALNNPQSENMYSNPNTTTPSTNMPMTSNMDSQYAQDGEMSSPLGVSSAQIGQALMQAYAAGDTSAIKQLQGMYDLATEFEKNAAPEMSQSTMNAMASSDNAINTIDQLQQLYTDAGSGSGRLGGAIKNFAADAGFDKNAKVYNSLSQASVTQIAKALAGSGAGTVSDMDAKVIIAALPTISDTPDEARAKFAALRQRLENARNNSMAYSGGGGGQADLLSALQASQ